jgi:putative transposase
MRLSGREGDELLCTRGIMVTDAAIRQWYGKFSHSYATRLRRRRPRPGDHGHLDGMILTIPRTRYDW